MILADQSLKHVSDFIGMPEDCDFPLLLSTISHYMTVHETELRNKDKEGFEKNPFEWEMRYVPNGDSYHKDVPYLRDASPAKGKAFAMVGVATNAGSLIDVIKASKIEQHGDFLYIDDDEKACMALLRGVPIFAHLSDEGLHTMVSNSTVRHFQKGSPIIAQGSRSSDVYVILSGKMEVTEEVKEVPRIII